MTQEIKNKKLEEKLLSDLQEKLPDLVNNLVHWLENPCNNENRPLVHNGKIDLEFFENKFSEPFVKALENELSQSLLAHSENPLRAKYQQLLTLIKSWKDNKKSLSKHFQDNIKFDFEVSLDEEEKQENYKVIQSMLKIISQNPEEEIDSKEKYEAFQKKIDSILDLSEESDKQFFENKKVRVEIENKPSPKIIEEIKSEYGLFQEEEVEEQEEKVVSRQKKTI